VLNGFNFNKPHRKVSMKPLDFTCILRLSKLQLQENGFKDAVVEKVYQQLLEYLASESHTISFPDVVVATVMQVGYEYWCPYLLTVHSYF
jgi:nucleolar complex protein 2